MHRHGRRCKYYNVKRENNNSRCKNNHYQCTPLLVLRSYFGTNIHLLKNKELSIVVVPIKLICKTNISFTPIKIGANIQSLYSLAKSFLIKSILVYLRHYLQYNRVGISLILVLGEIPMLRLPRLLLRFLSFACLLRSLPHIVLHHGLPWQWK